MEIVLSNGDVAVAHVRFVEKENEHVQPYFEDRKPKNWQTYNFEVEEFHTYIAAGVRVHNESIVDFIPPGSEILDLAVDDNLIPRNAIYMRPDGITVLLHGADINADGTTERLQETLLVPASATEASATIVQERFFDPVTGQEIGRHVVSMEYDSSVVQLEELGRSFGSALGGALTNGGYIQDIAVSTVAATLAQNVGEFLQVSTHLSLVQLDGVSLSSTPLIPSVSERDSCGDSQQPTNLNLWRKQEVCDGFSAFFAVGF